MIAGTVYGYLKRQKVDNGDAFAPLAQAPTGVIIIIGHLELQVLFLPEASSLNESQLL